MIKTVKTHPQFDKNFRKRILPNHSLITRFEKRLNIFLLDPNNTLLRNHKLIGKMKNLNSFSVTGDIRVVYQEISSDEVLFLDIGSHNQVY